MKLVTGFLALIMLLSVTLPGPTAARADRPGSGLETAGTGVQFLGFSDALNKTTFGGFGVIELSGLIYDARSDVYHAVADRAGSTASHFFTLEIPIGAESLGVPRVLGATVLKDAAGLPFNGLTLDAEAVALTRDNEVIIASEGGSRAGEQPEIRRFSLSGNQTGELPVPQRFLIGTNNLSFESVAVSPNGHSLFTIFEGPLAADGRTSDNRSRVRIIRYEDRGRDGFTPVAQYFYLSEPGRTTGDLGIADMIALSEDDLLVLERGFVAGQGNTIRIFRVFVEEAQDVSNEPTLAAPGLTPVAKRLVLDVADLPSAGATSPQIQPNPLLDNYEAMALGPELAGGRRVLVLLSDDNGSSSQITRIIALAVPTRDLVGDDDDEDGGNTK
jgi:hypothetical protein